MAYITPGIEEGLILDLANTQVSEKGALIIGMKSQDTGSSVDAVMAAIEGNTTLETAKAGKFYLWVPNIEKTVDDEKVVKSPTDLIAEMLNIRKYLLDIGYLYGPKEEAEMAYGGSVMFKGLGNDVKQIIAKITSEVVLKEIFKRLVTAFLNFVKIKSTLVDNSPFRHKFVRQSADKHYASLPYISSYDTIVESMMVPKEQSKVSFSKYEIEKGLNNPIPIPPDKTTGDAKKANDLYGNQNKPKKTAQGLI